MKDQHPPQMTFKIFYIYRVVMVSHHLIINLKSQINRKVLTSWIKDLVLPLKTSEENTCADCGKI